MAAQVGFVYVLVNRYMPALCKIGCTERSPHERADELSKGSGIPAPFEVLCYIEIRDCQAVERNLHRILNENRVSDTREFFECDLSKLFLLFFWYPNRLSFCVPQSDRYDADYQALVHWPYGEDGTGDRDGNTFLVQAGPKCPNPWAPPSAPLHLVEPATKGLSMDEWSARQDGEIA